MPYAWYLQLPQLLLQTERQPITTQARRMMRRYLGPLRCCLFLRLLPERIPNPLLQPCKQRSNSPKVMRLKWYKHHSMALLFDALWIRQIQGSCTRLRSQTFQKPLLRLQNRRRVLRGAEPAFAVNKRRRIAKRLHVPHIPSQRAAIIVPSCWTWPACHQQGTRSQASFAARHP